MFSQKLVTQDAEVRIFIFMQTCIDQRNCKASKENLHGKGGEAGVHALKLVGKDIDQEDEHAPLLTQRIVPYCAVFHSQSAPALGEIKNPKNVTQEEHAKGRNRRSGALGAFSAPAQVLVMEESDKGQGHVKGTEDNVLVL
jgi:hypothetical protein